MDPNEIPIIDSWANSGALDDDTWNPDWDEFVINWLHPSPQPPADLTLGCDWQMDLAGLMKWETVWEEAPEASQISGLLQDDAEFAVSTTDDNVRFQYETAQSIWELNQNAPLPPANHPSPDYVGHLPTSILDRTAWGPDIEVEKREDVSSIGVALVSPTRQWIPVEEEDLALKDPKTTTPPQAKAKPPSASRCAPCRFAGVPQAQCDGRVGSVCSRCQHLESKVDGRTRRRVNKGRLARPAGGPTPCPLQILVEPSETMRSLPEIIFFERDEARNLLVALRREIDQMSQFSSGESLESLFGGNLVCHIDDKGLFSQYSTTSSAVGIKRLATTATAAAASGANIITPALNGIQLDGFSRRRLPSYMSNMDALAKFDHGTLLTAWSCAYWITMLLNWDDNDLYLNPLTVGLHGGIDLADAKNLVLELTYSVAHHVQVLIQELCYRTMVSMTEADKHHNPTTICCALWIVFAAAHKFEKRNFAATSLTNLRNFLNKLHERSRMAFRSLDQYKRVSGARCCGSTRDNQGDFAKLIADARRPKATATFAFERHVTGTEGFLFHRGTDILNSGFRPQRYSEVLEAKVPFLQNDELFQNRETSRWGLTAPRPTNPTWNNDLRGLGVAPRADRRLIPNTYPLDYSTLTARNTAVRVPHRDAMTLHQFVGDGEARRSKRRASRSPSVSGMSRRAKTCSSDII